MTEVKDKGLEKIFKKYWEGRGSDWMQIMQITSVAFRDALEEARDYGKIGLERRLRHAEFLLGVVHEGQKNKLFPEINNATFMECEGEYYIFIHYENFKKMMETEPSLRQRIKEKLRWKKR